MASSVRGMPVRAAALLCAVALLAVLLCGRGAHGVPPAAGAGKGSAHHDIVHLTGANFDEHVGGDNNKFIFNCKFIMFRYYK